MGGEHDAVTMTLTNDNGSSPRGRGTRAGMREALADSRIIPAWAGNTVDGYVSVAITPDHPRVGGEHLQTDGGVRCGYGSSPRGRGTRHHLLITVLSIRIIPAWAGNTRTRCR